MGKCIDLQPRILAYILQMARSRRNLNESRPESPTDELSSDEHEARSPQEAPRGRTGKQTKAEPMDTAA